MRRYIIGNRLYKLDDSHVICEVGSFEKTRLYAFGGHFILERESWSDLRTHTAELTKKQAQKFLDENAAGIREHAYKTLIGPPDEV